MTSPYHYPAPVIARRTAVIDDVSVTVIVMPDSRTVPTLDDDPHLTAWIDGEWCYVVMRLVIDHGDPAAWTDRAGVMWGYRAGRTHDIDTVTSEHGPALMTEIATGHGRGRQLIAS